MTTILITGASGRLGKELVKAFTTFKTSEEMNSSPYEVLSPPHSVLDVTKANEVFKFIKMHKPDIVIHLAAAVSPVKCEIDKKWAFNTTVIGTMNLITALETIVPTCHFVLMSTPCVFSGKEGDYDESSIPYPSNFYGFTKALQELAVIKSNLSFTIVRGNFVPREKWPYPKAFTDRFGTYLFADQLAKAIKEVVDSKQIGLFHLVGNKKISMYELAKRCPDSEKVQPMTLEEYYRDNPNACHLTKDMSLKSVNWKKEYDIDAS